MGIRRILLAGATLLLIAAQARAQEAAPDLAPYQLVRSLQLVQDRIADGDHAALPMQRRILEMIDGRLSESVPEDFVDGRNFRALLIYAMSGGNPRTVERLLSGLVLDERDSRLGAGLLQYVRGQPGRAAALLDAIEPRDVYADVSPFLALVKGTIIAGKEPQNSLRLLDEARLLGPGTLIEEAALRRSMALGVQLSQPDRFIVAAEQYVRRFLRSPYASQFADAFVAGVVAQHASLDPAAIAGVVGAMTPDQQRVIYLRLARRAAIDRLDGLLAFATEGLERGAGTADARDPRAELYRALAEVAGGEPRAVASRLAAIDRPKLSASDRLLLDAALAILADVVAPPRVAAAAPRSMPSPAERDDELTDYDEPPANEEPPSELLMPAAATTAATAGPAAAPGSPEAYVAAARDRLDAVDRLLQETGR